MALWQRIARMALTSHSRNLTFIRMEYRRRFGISHDRKVRPGFSAPPTTITLVPTYRCNLDCVMCRSRAGAKMNHADRPWYDPKRELPVSTWVSFLDQVRSFHPVIYITGGEPHLYPDFETLVHEAKKRDLVVAIQTNGTLLRKTADFLVAECVDTISISLDGPPKVHDRIRRVEGTFRSLADGVRALIEARKRRKKPGPFLLFNFTISKSNYQYLEEFVETAADLGGDFIQIQHTMFNSPEKVAEHNAIFSPDAMKAKGIPMVGPSIGDGAYYESEIGSEDIPDLLARLDRARQRAKGKVIPHFMPNIPASLIAPYYLDLDFPFVERCDSFWRNFRIAPDGTVAPCLNLMLGNMAEQTFNEIWTGEPYQRVRQLFSERIPPGCLRCCQRHFVRSSRAM